MMFYLLCVLPTGPAILFLLFLWSRFKQFRRTKCLNNIPGPPSASIWTGVLKRFYNPIEGWDFHKHLLENYGGVVRIRGVLGVCLSYLASSMILMDVSGEPALRA
ncbi:hypothetical protein BJ165DRAFT_619859 [Panaeolus papilionaceus]|nr:hypothetical protein BJ165DRAFT_619859 [Panaeolus papilionaceus]